MNPTGSTSMSFILGDLTMKALEHTCFDTWTLVTSVLVLLTLVWFARTIYIAFQPGLRDIPGPWSAKFACLTRFKLIWAGKAHENYRKLHETYGSIVRTAPNVVDISDPNAIPIIYGINSKYYKVKFFPIPNRVPLKAENDSHTSMMSSRSFTKEHTWRACSAHKILSTIRISSVRSPRSSP